MATITPTLDTTYLRVGVNLAAWTTDGPLDVFRVHSDGSRNLVRGMSAVSGGVAFGWDYEMPLSVPVTYEAWNGATLITSAPITAPVGFDVAMLTVPGLPSFGGVILPAKKPALTRARTVSTLQVIGRSNPIVKGDVMRSPSFTLDLYTRTDADAYSLTSTLGMSNVFLLRMPGTRVTDWCYVAVTGDVDETPGVDYKDRPDSGRIDGQFSRWSMPCQVVESPVGGVFGDPTATYQASLDQFPTYADRLAAHDTYLDALRG